MDTLAEVNSLALLLLFLPFHSFHSAASIHLLGVLVCTVGQTNIVMQSALARLPPYLGQVPVHVPEVLKLIGSLSEDLCLSFFSLFFIQVTHLPMKLATLPSVCVCVCVREREIERGCIFGHVFALVPTD